MLSVRFSIIRRSSVRKTSPGGLVFSPRSISRLTREDLDQRVEDFSRKDVATPINKHDQDEYNDIKRELLESLTDLKLKTALVRLEKTVEDLNFGSADIKNYIKKPNWNLAHKALPFSGDFLNSLKNLWETTEKASPPPMKTLALDSYPPIKKIMDSIEEGNKKIENILKDHREISKRQNISIVEKMKEVAYFLNNYQNLTIYTEANRSPEFNELVDEEVIAHHWDASESKLVQFETNANEIDRAILSEIFGANHQIVKSYDGNVKSILPRV